MTRKPQRESRSPRDRLSQDFLRDLAVDWAANGAAAVKAMRVKSPERYVEATGKAIASAEEPSDELDFKSCNSIDEIGEKLLKNVGCECPTRRMIKAAVTANNQFLAKLQRIAGVVRDDSANGKQPAKQTSVESEVTAMNLYLEGKP